MIFLKKIVSLRPKMPYLATEIQEYERNKYKNRSLV